MSPEPRPAGGVPEVLVVDIGGAHVKLLASGQTEPRRFDSGPALTPREMVAELQRRTADWGHDAVSIGYPGAIVDGRIVAEPHNLGPGWVGFDFERALGRPVRLINDAAMQALGSYQRGRMLFLGLGTGLGSALIADGVLVPLELAHLPYKKGESYEDYVGQRGLDRLGKSRWRAHVARVVAQLRAALQADDVVLGGGNARNLKELPPGARLGDNAHAFTGGFRLWEPERRARSTPEPPRAGSPAPARSADALREPERMPEASPPSAVVFLFDVDNTLLDNDRVAADLRRHLRREFGAEREVRYWAIFEELRSELGYADYLGALQRYRVENPRDPRVLAVSSFLIKYPFANRLFPGSLDVLERCAASGPTVILSDGDVVFQPRKIERSSLYDAVDGRVLIYIHKEQELGDVERRFPADHYVLVDDKIRILGAAKKVWGERLTTVFPRQGHYARAPEVAHHPPADLTIDRIGALLEYDLPALLALASTRTQAAKS